MTKRIQKKTNTTEKIETNKTKYICYPTSEKESVGLNGVTLK